MLGTGVFTNLWPHQEYALREVPRLVAAGARRICVTSPTGGGKSRVICGLVLWGASNGWQVALYTNRRLLVSQLTEVLTAHGIQFGVRASGYHDDRQLPVQISSLPTERQRVLVKKTWAHHGAGLPTLAIVDEAHLNKEATATKIVDLHIADGGIVVGFTATPIDLAHLYRELVVAGTPGELRRCGALVPAYHYGVDEPDMRKFKASVKTGEYTERDVRKAIMTKAIMGRVWDYYSTLNADRRPTILFGPGVAESLWFAQQLAERGVRAAHLDGEGVWLDGAYRREGREDVLKLLKKGDVQVLCNRFVAREGIDVPEVSHVILATVMGSLQSYLQSVGRGMRAAPGKRSLTIQDHGGHWWRHGSVNQDRDWNLGWTEGMIAGVRGMKFQEHREREPIHCPRCGLIRQSGSGCPKCGHETQKRSRFVMQLDGTLREHEGDIYKPRRVRLKDNTQKVWEQAYYRAKNSKNKMTFRQAEALFFMENHYYPPRDLPLMPQNDYDWFRPVCSVATERLVGREPITA